MAKKFLFKKAYLNKDGTIAYLIQLFDKRFYKVTDDNKGGIEVYKFKDGTFDIEYAIWYEKFKTADLAFDYLKKLDTKKKEAA